MFTSQSMKDEVSARVMASLFDEPDDTVPDAPSAEPV
jgi:hypothetical protein